MRKILLLLACCLLLVSCRSSEGRKQVQTLKELSGAVIGVQLGTTSDVLATELEKKGDGTHVERFTKGTDAVQSLRQGKIDCMVTDEAPAKAFQRVTPSLYILPQTFDKSDFAICVAKKNYALLGEINAALKALKDKGVIDSIVDRHMVKHQAVAYEWKGSTKNGGRKIRFATNATFEPFEYYDGGKIVGIDVDVAHAIGDQMGVGVEIVDVEFDAIIASVQTGKIDAGIAGITVTPERQKNISFTDTYACEKQVVVVDRSGSVTEKKEVGLVDKFKACFIVDGRYLYLLQGLGNTLLITLFSIVLSMMLGTLIAIVRATHDSQGTHRVLNAFCQVYLSVVRGTPTMVQLLIIYYVVFASADVNKLLVAVIAFGLNSAAYVAEVIRSGIISVDRGQMEAGRSLGLSYSKTMRLIILPQAFKNVLPALGNELITLLKETSISGYIGVVDLTKGSDIIRSITYEAMLPLGIVAAIYFLIVVGLYRIVRQLEKFMRKGER